MNEETVINWWVVVIAAYAAVVATGVLALEVRRWFESGARLSISLMPEGKTVNIPGTEDNTYLIATVSNRGNAPTTITHFTLRDYGNLFGRLRSKAKWTVVIPMPHLPGATSNIPMTVQPGEIWSGMALHNEELMERIKGGHLYVEIYASHADKPTLKRVHIPAQPPEDAEEI